MKCLECGTVFPSKNSLIKHYQKEHNIDLNFEYLMFATVKEFEKWISPHYRLVNSWKTALDIVRKYRCHRSGMYVDECLKNHRQRKRRLRSIGSKKLQGFCPAEVTARVRRKDGLCIATLQKVHVGHDINDIKEIKYIRLTKDERKSIGNQLLSGVPKDSILQKIHPDYNPDIKDTRQDTVDTEDVETIAAEFGAKKPFPAVEDPTYIEEFVSQNGDSILFYKKKRETDVRFNVFEYDDFVLILQDESQKRSLEKYGCKSVAFDGPYGVYPYNYVLHTMLVADAETDSVPVAYLVSNRSDQVVVDTFVRCVKDNVGTVSARTLITNMDATYPQSWCSIMAPPKFLLYCTRHVRNAWKYYLNKLILAQTNKLRPDGATITAADRRDITTGLRRKLYDLADDLVEHSFLKKLTAFLSDGNAITEPFLQHFQENYTNNTLSWALCYRKHAILNGNAHIEAFAEEFHRILKFKIAEGNKIETLSAGLYCIQEYRKYRESRVGTERFRQKPKKPRGFPPRGHVKIEYSEDESITEYYDSDSEESECPSGNAASDTVLEIYSIRETEMEDYSLCPDPCGLFCELCNSRYHQVGCSCSDATPDRDVCRHIRVVVAERQIQELSKTDAVRLEDSPKTIEFEAVCESPEMLVKSEVEEEDIDDVENSLENFRVTVEEDFRKVAEGVKSCITPENIELCLKVYPEIYRRFVLPVCATFEEMLKNCES